MTSPKTRLQQYGLRATKGQLRVLAALESSPDRSLDADEVFRHLLGHDQAIGQATVYRALRQLVDAGAIFQEMAVGACGLRATYTYRRDDSARATARLVCSRCGFATLLENAAVVTADAVEAALPRFDLRQQPLTLHAVCHVCAAGTTGGKAVTQAAGSAAARP